MTTAMESSRLTEEQRAALAAHGQSISLAAGAGCGKTFVLTERFLSYVDPQILDPAAELDELVAITFTDAAAREMRDRIRRRCYERYMAASEPRERQAWRQLQRSLDTARISTIHSFCGNLLRTYAVEARVDPQFEQLDQTSADLLRLRSLDDRLRQLLIEKDERLIQLAARFGLRALREYLANLLGEDLDPVLSRWGDATPDALIARWKQYAQDYTTPALVAELLATPCVQTLREVCQSAQGVATELRDLLDSLLQLFDQLSHSTEPQELLADLRNLARVQPGPAVKRNWGESEDYDRFRQACAEFRRLIDKSILRRPWSEEHLQDTARTGLDLLAVLADVARCYALAKQERNALEFDDLLRKVHELLTVPEYGAVQRELAGSTRLLLVDEFQDTDPLQVAIVQAFCGPHWNQEGLFVVGDFKQSVYRFRGAEPRVSRELRQSLPPRSRLSLTTNFRSQGAILDFVNALFCDAFEEVYEPLRPSRPQQTPLPAVEFIWAPSADDDDDVIPAQLRGAQRARFREARYIARRLRELIDCGEPLIVEEVGEGETTLRPLQQGDVAILLRSLSDIHVYEAALAQQGLEYFLVGGHAFYAQQEIYDVLHLLRTVVSEADELSLAGALRSPLFSLQDETLFWLVQLHGSLQAALHAKTYPTTISEQETRKIQRVQRVVAELRNSKDHMLVAELLSKAIELTGFDAVLLGEFLGERKLANLHKLLEQARDLDRTNPGDLAGFVTQLSEFVSRAPKEALATTTAAGDVIRVMTIHNSKGLEFPLVVVPDLERGNKPPSSQPILSAELGPLVPAADAACVGWDLFHAAERIEEQNERIRLLYVACTRAADYLILSSSIKDLQKPTSDWMKFLAQRFDLLTGECLAALPAEYTPPQIRVTTSEPSCGRMESKATRGPSLTDIVAKTRASTGDQSIADETGVQPISPNRGARRSFSFSRLSGELHQTPPGEEAEQGVAEQPRLDPLGLGTLVHAVLERVPVGFPPLAASELTDLCRHLAPQHLEIDADEAAEEAGRLVGRFLAGDRFHQLATARCVLREVEFILPWKLPHRESTGHYLYGVIDCLYQDPQGGWHLIDYKSNQVSDTRVPATAAKYELQMFVYGLACERALGTAPVEQTLCFLRPGAEYSFNWTSTETRDLAAKLEGAIAKLLGTSQCIQASVS